MNTITHEIINYQSNVPIKLFYQRIGSVAKHWHNSIEILFVLSGTMTAAVEDRTWQLQEDDILLINPHHIHETHSEDCSLIVVQIRLGEFNLDWAIPENIQFDCNSATGKNNKDRYYMLKHHIVTLLKNNSAGSDFSQLSNYTCALELIRELCTHFEMQSPLPAPHSIKYLNRLKSILDYMNQNYRESITLGDMARREFLTPTYLSAFFEKTMGTTLTAYLNNIRLSHALQALLETDHSMEKIAEDNGFANARSFATAFQRAYGCRPSQYRKQSIAAGHASGGQGQQILTDRSGDSQNNGKTRQPPALLPPLIPAHQKSYLELEHYDFLDKLAPYIDGPMSKPAAPAPIHPTATDFGTISADSDEGTFNDSFKAFCGVSRASELLLPQVQAMLRRVQKEIHFKYIKFHGILDDDLMVCTAGADGVPHLCFTYVDMIIDFLMELHLKPMIQLSFMPRCLASHPDHVIFQKPVIISEPKDDRAWCSLVRALTMHLLDRYGRSEVRSWIFTFWNETLNGLSFDFPQGDTALRLYRITRQCVKECDSGLRFASTSYSALEFPEFNYDRFLRYAKDHECLPDIFIFHFYPVVTDNNAFSLQAQQWKAEDFTAPVALSRDPDIFQKFLTDVHQLLPQWLNPLAANVPVYITEWNFTPSHREWLGDTCYAACYLVRNLLQNFRLADGFCHWCLTDLHQELPMPKALFHGGMGLFTRTGIPKPAYYGYIFIDQLYPRILHQAEGCFVTTDGRDFALLLYNYVHFNNLYGHGITFDVTHANWQNAFPHARPRAISLTLTDVDRGSYVLTETHVDPEHGSPLEQWLVMGSPDLENDWENDLLRHSCAPAFHKSAVTVADGAFTYECRLNPHEIRLVRLTRKYADLISH